MAQVLLRLGLETDFAQLDFLIEYLTEAMQFENDLAEFAIGALAGAVIMTAVLHAQIFRSICLTGLAAGSVYLLFHLGVGGTVVWAEDIERHEALLNPAVVGDHCRRPVAAG